MTQLQSAISVRDGLRVKLDSARARLEALNEGRKSIALAAHTGDAGAEKKLAELNKERLVLVGDIETLEAAHVEASRRVSEAEHDAEVAADAAKANEAIEIAAEIEKIGASLDKHLAGLGDCWNKLEGAFNRLHNCGPTHPSHQQRESFGERAVMAALMKVNHRVDGMRFLPPSERFQFVGLTQGWSEMVRRWAEQRLPNREAAE